MSTFFQKHISHKSNYWKSADFLHRNCSWNVEKWTFLPRLFSKMPISVGKSFDFNEILKIFLKCALIKKLLLLQSGFLTSKWKFRSNCYFEQKSNVEEIDFFSRTQFQFRWSKTRENARSNYMMMLIKAIQDVQWNDTNKGLLSRLISFRKIRRDWLKWY